MATVVWLVVLTSLLSITLIVLIVGLVLYLRQLNRTTREIELTLREMRGSIVPLAEDARRTIADVDELLHSSRMQVERVGWLVQSVQNLIEGRTVVDVANRAVSTSKTTLVSVLEGIKQGLRTLRGSREEVKEDVKNEQQ